MKWAYRPLAAGRRGWACNEVNSRSYGFGNGGEFSTSVHFSADRESHDCPLRIRSGASRDATIAYIRRLLSFRAHQSRGREEPPRQRVGPRESGGPAARHRFMLVTST